MGAMGALLLFCYPSVVMKIMWPAYELGLLLDAKDASVKSQNLMSSGGRLGNGMLVPACCCHHVHILWLREQLTAHNITSSTPQNQLTSCISNILQV